MKDFNVYVIHSAKPLEMLKNLLTQCGGYSYAGIIYRSSRRKSVTRGMITEKGETRKTIVFCPSETIEKMMDMYPEYRKQVNDYNWDSFPMPTDEQGETWQLHISGVPNDYTVQDAEDFVENSLNCVLPRRNSSSECNYTIDFTPRLRETSEIYGFGQLNFSESVDRESIKMCKLVLHNTPIPFKTEGVSGKRMVTCVWHRPPQTENRYYQMGSPRRILQRARPASSKMPQVNVSNIENSDGLPKLTTTTN